jgi:hypothetical protein
MDLIEKLITSVLVCPQHEKNDMKGNSIAFMSEELRKKNSCLPDMQQ